MRSYTTLGEGRATKVLSVVEHSTSARTVTTCDLPVAKQLCLALSRTDRCLPVELFELAVSLDGAPVQARRTLLSFYDASLSGEPTSAGEHWVAAETLVSKLAAAVAGAPDAVQRAVRDELADHLTGMDGVLVPARAVLDQHKAMTVDLVISGPLEWMSESFWEYLLGPHGDLGSTGDDERFGLGGELVCTVELHGLLSELYDAEPNSYAFSAFSVRELFDAADDDSGIAPELLVRTDHLLAWVRHHRPGDAAVVAERLATSS